MTAFTIDVGDRAMQIAWSDGCIATFPWLWLADSEPAAFDRQTEERSFDLLSVPDDLRPVSVSVAEDAVLVTWPQKSAPSRIAVSWLKEHVPGRRRHDPADIEPELWRADAASDIAKWPAADLIDSDAALRAWMQSTVRVGFSLVQGIQGGPEGGVAIAERVGFLRRTNFGVTFEVVSKPDPNNLAFTAQALPLHTDLANQETPPGYQFLHCIASEAEGGGSVLCDGFAVVEDLRHSDPEAFRVLAEVAIPFRFHDRDYDIRGRYPVIGLTSGGRLAEIRFNAHLVDILDLPADDLNAFYRAYRRFMCMLRDPAYARAFRLAAGEMVVFDNRRVLHGRQAFDPATGFRYLNGCYVDRGEFLSRIRVLARS